MHSVRSAVMAVVRLELVCTEYDFSSMNMLQFSRDSRVSQCARYRFFLQRSRLPILVRSNLDFTTTQFYLDTGTSTMNSYQIDALVRLTCGRLAYVQSSCLF
jgi:hypothetical protein